MQEKMSTTFQEFNRNLIKDLRANAGTATLAPWTGRQLLILSTTGARSGEPRETPLVFTRSGADYVVIASKGGAPSHPAWFHNLVAHPEVQVEVGGERFRARARVAEGEERDRLYEAQSRLLPNFAEYQRKTSRQIPVVVLERIDKPA